MAGIESSLRLLSSLLPTNTPPEDRKVLGQITDSIALLQEGLAGTGKVIEAPDGGVLVSPTVYTELFKTMWSASLVAAQNLPAGTLVRIGSDGQVYKAAVLPIGVVFYCACIGIIEKAAVIGQPIVVVFVGLVHLPLATLAPGTVYMMSNSGDLTPLADNSVSYGVTVVGVAVTTKLLYFNTLEWQ